jgi:hypothetical protein
VASWMARAASVAAEVSCPAMATRCELGHGAAGRGRTSGCGVADRGRMTCHGDADPGRTSSHGDAGARSGHGDAGARKKKRRWVRNEDGKVIASAHRAHKRCNRPVSKETEEIRVSIEPGFECFKVRVGQALRLGQCGKHEILHPESAAGPLGHLRKRTLRISPTSPRLTSARTGSSPALIHPGVPGSGCGLFRASPAESTSGWPSVILAMVPQNGSPAEQLSTSLAMFGWYRLVLVVVVVFNTSKLTHKN